METWSKILLVAAGGAFGAVARYAVNVSPLAGALGRFPLPTFVINVVGSFLIGLCLVIFTDRFDVAENIRSAVLIGFIGAFTTFSTFELEIYTLIKDRLFLTAFTYIAASIVTGFIGVALGIELGKRI